MKFCPKCGTARASEVARFCGQCGFSYEAAGVPVAPAPVVVAPTPSVAAPVIAQVISPAVEISAPATPAPLPPAEIDERTQFAGREFIPDVPVVSAPVTNEPVSALAFGPGFSPEAHCSNCGQPRVAGAKWCDLCDKVF